jgi:hypothetical protein
VGAFRALAFAGALGWLSAAAGGEPALPDGEELARRINARERAEQASRVATLTLYDERRAPRQRRILALWKLTPNARHLALFALGPPEIKHEAFLAIDHFDPARNDDMWIYKPSRRRAQRIGEPRRGDPFLGSDFSFEAMKKEDRVEIGEYTWKTLGAEVEDGRNVYRLEQVPATSALARSLGTSRIVSFVDAETWLRRRIDSWDLDGKPKTSLEVVEARPIDGFWTATRIVARDLRSSHRSELHFDEVDYGRRLDDEIFSVRTLERERGGALAAGAAR